jgi:ABC-type phosphate/phosphonate transport system substrate-binding protein
MIASLPMYDRPETAAANDRLWTLIRDGMRAAGLAAPEALTRGANDLWPQWTSPDLAFSQTCGFPFRARLHATVTLVGTPDYGIECSKPGYYRSVFVVRADDPRATLPDFSGARFAFNDAMSQSGWAAPQTYAQGLGLRLPPALESGGHRLSALAVLQGRADIAALDAVTWRLLRRWEPEMAGLRAIEMTDPSPGLPFIASRSHDAEQMFAIVDAAIRGMPSADRDATGIRGLIRIPAETYLAVPTPASPEQFAHSD